MMEPININDYHRSHANEQESSLIYVRRWCGHPGSDVNTLNYFQSKILNQGRILRRLSFPHLLRKKKHVKQIYEA